MVYPGLYFWDGEKNRRMLKLPRAKEKQPSPRLVQPEYLPLPAYRYASDPQGRIVFCWQLDWRARLKVLFGGKLWHQVLTFNQPLQPQLLTVEKPEMPQ